MNNNNVTVHLCSSVVCFFVSLDIVLVRVVIVCSGVSYMINHSRNRSPSLAHHLSFRFHLVE